MVASMNRFITVYLNIGDRLMPQSVGMVPRVGEIVNAGPFGPLIVLGVEYDAQGDPHLHVDEASDGCSISTSPAPPAPKAA